MHLGPQILQSSQLIYDYFQLRVEPFALQFVELFSMTKLLCNTERIAFFQSYN